MSQRLCYPFLDTAASTLILIKSLGGFNQETFSEGVFIIAVQALSILKYPAWQDISK
jgi:hypothetical protein